MHKKLWLISFASLLLAGCVLPPSKTQSNFKIADSDTPAAQDRLFFDFKYVDAVPTGRCVGPLLIERSTADGAAKTAGDTTISVPSDSIYGSNDCSRATTTVNIPDGKSSAEFFFRTQQPGEHVFTATSSGYAPVNAKIRVQKNTIDVDGTFFTNTISNTSDLQLSFILNDSASTANNICGFQFDLSTAIPALPTASSATIRVSDGTNAQETDWVCSVTDFLLTCTGNDTVKAGALTTADITINGELPSIQSVPVELLTPEPSVVVPMTIRSYGVCADGSCGERFVTVTGTFK